MNKHSSIVSVPVPAQVKLSIAPQPIQLESFPKISCIMATKNRQAFVEKSVEYFLAQTWPNKELIVVEDGPFAGSKQDYWSSLPECVKYILEGSSTIGAKRNKGIKHSSGEFIAVWDDDEWQSPNRLALQYTAFAHNEDKWLTGIYRPIFGVLSTRKLYIWNGHRPSKAWCSGSTIMFRRKLFERVRYPSLNVGEDTQFITDVPQELIYQMEYSGFNVSYIHDGNTVSKDVSSAYVELHQPFPV